MTDYTYTLSPPSSDPAENKRLGYRTPRSILLPPYFATNPLFVDFMDAIDEVFEPLVDQKTEILGDLRNVWVTNPDLENNQIANSEMIPFEAWSQPERQLLVMQVNALGLKLQNAGIISDDSYQVISRWAGQYWFGKGTQSFINFINYCLSSSLTVTPLWTEDYVNFVPVGDPTIGTPIWEGGSWYPTTHVALIAQGGLGNLDIATLVSFFYEIANYNLVLYSVEIEYNMWITDDPQLIRTDAEVVAIGLWANSSIVISNLFSYGADAPATFDTEPDLPTGAYSTQPTNTNFSDVYILAAPTAWIQAPNGQTVPVYTSSDQTITNGADMPTTFCGNQPATTGEVMMIFGPVDWIDVPGSSRSDARIPVFSSVPVARTAALSELPTQIVGNQRANLLCNPDGWTEMVPGSGQWTPYWETT
jgi:hypothetical protein